MDVDFQTHEEEKEEQELSLHYTLTQGDTEQSQEPKEDNFFDPFAIEDNNKKFGNIETEKKLPQTVDIQDDVEMEKNENEANEEKLDQTLQITDDKLEKNAKNESLSSTDTIEEKLPQTLPIEDDVDMDDSDEDISDDENDEDDDLRKEMEENFKKSEESEKNKGMLDIINMIKSKAANKENEKKVISPKLQKLGIDVPKLKPLAFNGSLKISFSSTHSEKEAKIQKHRFHHEGKDYGKKRKEIKKILKNKLSKKRKKEMKQHRKEFGNEEDYFDEDEDEDGDDNENEEEELRQMEEEEKEIEEVKDVAEEERESDHESDNDVEEMEASKYIEKIVENGDDLDEEDIARAALMAKRQIIPDEVRELMAIDADEEDENGQINVNVEDEEEEKYGIAKDLLAEKSELRLLKQNQEIYDAKRNEAHRQMIHNEDDKALELMKKAFIDGDYRQLQTKHGKNKFDSIMCSDGTESRDALNELKFRSRNSELDARNEPEYYLSDNEEKNEWCCYDAHGEFLNVHQIRMKINEWNRKHNALAMHDDDEEDAETVKRRKKRVKKREVIQSYDTMDGHGLINKENNKIGSTDKSAINILAKLRNKKRKKPKLTKSQTLDSSTNFGSFYLEKGLKIAKLQSRSSSSSFLSHRDKCIQKVKLAESKSQSNSGLTTSAGPGSSNANRFLFQRLPTNKKRKRDNNCYNDNLSKKRKLQ